MPDRGLTVGIPEPRHYWLGNAAKTKVISDLLRRASARAITVFDYGCGDGGDWPGILSDFGNIRLIAYEPFTRSRETARARLKDHDARFVSEEDLFRSDFHADFIVSFSVFEHVSDRNLYLKTAKGHLSNDGIFYLNYDDGHFRYPIELGRIELWYPQFKEFVHNFLSRSLPGLTKSSWYQRRVLRDEVDEAVKSAGFSVFKTEYGNLTSMKNLYKSIPESLKQEFAGLWLALEERLNERFMGNGDELYGDTANLWQQMTSRTLYLRHSS